MYPVGGFSITQNSIRFCAMTRTASLEVEAAPGLALVAAHFFPAIPILHTVGKFTRGDWADYQWIAAILGVAGYLLRNEPAFVLVFLVVGLRFGLMREPIACDSATL